MKCYDLLAILPKQLLTKPPSNFDKCVLLEVTDEEAIT